MSGAIATIPKLRFTDASGAPIVGGTLAVYAAGTTTPENTWQDRALSILNTNPITLDGNGACVVWLDSAKSYKIVLKDAGGSVQWTQDNIEGGGVDTSFELSVAAIDAAVTESQNWATQTGSDVTGAPAGSRSAKSWATDDLTPSGAGLGGSAKDWATSTSLPDGANRSAKSYAADASGSATAAATSRAAIDNRIYPGLFAGDPAVRPDGSACQNGDLANVGGVVKMFNAGVWAIVPGASAADLASSTDPAKGASLVGYKNNSVRAHLDRLQNATLERWFAGGIAGKKIVLVGDSTSDYAYGLHRALLNYYTRRGRELEGVAVLNYGTNGQTLANWLADGTRYGKQGTIATNADLFVFDYGINDARTGAKTEDQMVALIEQAVDALTAGVPETTVLLRVPNTFTTTNTGALNFVSPDTADAAQAYSTLLRNAYKRVAVSRNCPILDTQSLVFGLTSKSDAASPYMLNQIHANDAGNQAIARELVKMIGTTPKQQPFTFGMRGKVAVGVLAKRTVNNAGRVAFGFADYRPTAGAGSLTIEIRKYPVGGGAYSVIGTVTYSGGIGSGNVMTPAAATTDWTSLVSGDAIEVAVTACTVTTRDLEVFLLLDESPRAQAYPLQLRYDGLRSPLDGSVVYAATQPLSSLSERTIGPLTALKFWRLGTNRFKQWSQDATQAVWNRGNVTVTGTPGNQTITGTATNCAASLNAVATAGEQLTYSWKATKVGTPTYAVYDGTNGAFIVPPTAWPAADGAGWMNVTFVVPAGCAQVRCYPIASVANVGESVTVQAMQLSPGAARTASNAPTNNIGTSMVVSTGALPSEFTRIHLVKVDAFVAAAVSVVGPGGPLANGNPALQAENGGLFGYPVIPTRATAARGAVGTWQVAVLRYTGGNAYVSINDQGQSTPYAAPALDAADMRWNLLSSTDVSGAFQNWDGEVISEFYPYLLSEGEAAARVRELLRTLQANGELVTADWPAQKLS